MYKSTLLLAGLAKLAVGGTVLWDGRFNDVTSNADIEAWSWSNQVGPYQYYIHGSSAISSYVNLDSTFKNPADTGSTQGVKITLDDTAFWNGQTMRRTELIPQTTAAINAGKVYYHFSMQRTEVNSPDVAKEHQIAFFESHFTEMKYGGSSGITNLTWNAASTGQWSTAWEAGVWHNIAYEIDFDAGSVAFWHSTGADDLVLTVPAVTVSASSDGKDWHLGVLELPLDGSTDATEDIYFSGVYVESGDLTTSVSGAGGAAAAPAASSSVSSAISVASTPVPTISSILPSTTASSVIATSAVAQITSSAVDIGSKTTMATSVRSTASAKVSVTSSAPISSPISTPIDEDDNEDDDDEC